MVARAIPDAWRLADPAQIIATRFEHADRTLRSLLSGETLDSPDLAEAATLARQAAETAAPQGRPLFAAYTALAWPQEPHLTLWHAATLLREHRRRWPYCRLAARRFDTRAKRTCSSLPAARPRGPRSRSQPSLERRRLGYGARQPAAARLARCRRRINPGGNGGQTADRRPY